MEDIGPALRLQLEHERRARAAVEEELRRARVRAAEQTIWGSRLLGRMLRAEAAALAVQEPQYEIERSRLTFLSEARRALSAPLHKLLETTASLLADPQLSPAARKAVEDMVRQVATLEKLSDEIATAIAGCAGAGEHLA